MPNNIVVENLDESHACIIACHGDFVTCITLKSSRPDLELLALTILGATIKIGIGKEHSHEKNYELAQLLGPLALRTPSVSPASNLVAGTLDS